MTISETMIQIGGVFAVVFAVFHLFFWKLFHWKTDLAKLTALNRAVMQILNLCLMFVFVIVAYVSLAHTNELLSTRLGRTLLVLIAVCWYFRAALQIVFFGLRTLLSMLLFVTFLAAGTLYALPLLDKNPPAVAGASHGRMPASSCLPASTSSIQPRCVDTRV